MKNLTRYSLALRQVLLSSALLLAPGVATWAAETPPSTSVASIPADSLYGLRVALTDSQGVAFDWREMAGAPVLVTMFYGDCASACPVLIESLQRTIAELKPAPGSLKVLMVSLNPKHDTPASLMHLMHMHKIDGNVFRLAVAADEGQTRAMAAALQIKYRQLENGEISHNTRVALLNASGEEVASSTQLKSTADAGLLAELRKALK